MTDSPATSATTTATPSTVTTTTTLKPGWKTTEFWLALVAKLLGALFAAGYLGDGSTLARVAGLAAIVLTYLGYSVSRGIVKAAAPVLLIVLLGNTQTGCSWFRSESKTVAGDLVDCTMSTATSNIAQYGPLVDQLLVYATDGGGKVNGDAIAAATKGFAKQVGGCVLADAIARALKPPAANPAAPKASPLVADPDSLRQVLAALYPGAHFKTANGEL